MPKCGGQMLPQGFQSASKMPSSSLSDAAPKQWLACAPLRRKHLLIISLAPTGNPKVWLQK